MGGSYGLMSLRWPFIKLQPPACSFELEEPDNDNRLRHHLSESAIMSNKVIDYYTC